MSRHVRGLLFVDYVRMIRGNKDVDWTRYLVGEDFGYLVSKIDPEGWYPMESFERFGIAILNEVAKHQLPGVEMWGRFQVMSVRAYFRELIVPGEPSQTLMRFRVLARSFFDYGAIEVVSIHEGDALVAIAYQMGDVAEETACHQTLGFFVGLLEASGATEIHARFIERSWKGGMHTLLDLRWIPPEISSDNDRRTPIG